jgi:sugar/nucleoside kinase (ribokinase family)
VDVLPPKDVDFKKQMLEELTRSPPPKEAWKVGGSTNAMIAAARLGLNVWSCGHIANDGFGRYMLQILRVRLQSDFQCGIHVHKQLNDATCSAPHSHPAPVF